MSHECDECGQAFDTLTRLRLHECSSGRESGGEPASSPGTGENNSTPAGWEDDRSDAVEIGRLDDLLGAARDGEFDALYQAVATYESELRAASEGGATEEYRGIRRAYAERLIAALDEATQATGWPFLEDFLDAYHPASEDEFPHVTTVLQNVAGRYLIRTRLADGVETIPAAALEYFETIRTSVGEHQDFIVEGLHPYGWGIGHPDVAVADNMHAHAAEDIFATNAMLEHAFYADQHAAVELLERIARDESIAEELALRPGETISEARYLLDAPAGAASDEYWPTIPRYWDWHDELDYEFELAEEVEERIRALVTAEGIDDGLPEGWEIADLTL